MGRNKGGSLGVMKVKGREGKGKEKVAKKGEKYRHFQYNPSQFSRLVSAQKARTDSWSDMFVMFVNQTRVMKKGKRFWPNFGLKWDSPSAKNDKGEIDNNSLDIGQASGGSNDKIYKRKFKERGF